MMNQIEGLDVQGHRGAMGLYPENTLPGFQAAIEAGVNTLELDLQVTKYGEILIYHDYFLNENTSSSQVPLHLLTLDEIKKVDCGSNKDPQFPRRKQIPGIQIPTLDQLFTLIQNSSNPNAKTVRLNLEIKRDPSHPEFTLTPRELALKVLSKVYEHSFSQRVYFSSFDPAVLKEIHQLDKEVVLGFVFGEVSLLVAKKFYPKNPLEGLTLLATSFNAKIISPQCTLILDKKFVQSLKKKGFKVVTWTLNSPEDWDKYITFGVDGIITDYPHDLVEFKKKFFM